MDKVIVADIDGNILASTNSGNARRLLKSGEASINTKEPFSIILSKKATAPKSPGRTTPMTSPINLFDYFDKPKTVYIQNISNPLGVISLTFTKNNGEKIQSSLPARRDPIRLTDNVPFDVIKESTELRHYINPMDDRAPKLALLTEEGYNKFFADKHKIVKDKTPEQLAMEAQRSLGIAVPMPEQFAPLNTPVKVTPAITVQPRIISLCQQLDPKVSDHINAATAIEKIESLSPTTVDYDYIIGHCPDKIVYKWANKQLAILNGPDEAIVKEVVGNPVSEVKKPRKPRQKKTEEVQG